MMTKNLILKNKDVNWDEFEPLEYLESNYVSILPPDREIVQKLVTFYEKEKPSGEFIEIGCGPNLYPVLAMLPYAQKITILEIGKQNISYLRNQLKSFDPIWQQWIKLLQTLSPIYLADLHRQYKSKIEIKSGSLFDLPQNKYQLASMHFVAESIPPDLKKFNLANKSFMLSLIAGGIFSVSYMEGSEGYSNSGKYFPAVRISKKEVEKALLPFASELTVKKISANNGLVRKGHTGMIFAFGRRKIPNIDRM